MKTYLAHLAHSRGAAVVASVAGAYGAAQLAGLSAVPAAVAAGFPWLCYLIGHAKTLKVLRGHRYFVCKRCGRSVA